MDKGLIRLTKKVATKIMPGYRVALRNEQRLERLLGTNTDSEMFKYACLALEVHETHMASFSEFKKCHKGCSVVIVACGPSMKYYTQISNFPHVGVNASFQNPNISLDYYFTTDYAHKNPWFEDLKYQNFVKFFGQFPAGKYRDMFQIPERLIEENNGRRFFLGAPSEDIHLNIEYYPLMGFHSIVFQAIHFSLYTRPDRIFLVGCDCSADGYFDGSPQLDDVMKCGIPYWLRGYRKLKDFVTQIYPEMEIISINPVGLKGLFQDVYTPEYLAAHPKNKENGCKMLRDVL